jgi:hypothetical protein
MSDNLSGFLLWGESTLVKSAISRLRRLAPKHDPTDGWHTFDYTVEEEISGVETEEGPPFTHSLLVRAGGDRLMILSNNYRICEHFLDRDLRREVRGSLKKADILVHELVVALSRFRKTALDSTIIDGGDPDSQDEGPQPSEDNWAQFNLAYALGYGFARSDAFSGNLQKIEFEGEDLSLVPLFVEAIPFLRFRNCGLRQRVLDERGFPSSIELVRVSKTGFISFGVPSSERGRRDRFKDVEVVLRSLSKFGYIK